MNETVSHNVSSLSEFPLVLPIPDERSTSAPSRLSSPREEVRTALLNAVGDLIQRHGYRKTSVDDIAQEASVSRATAYLYFANKEALVMAWIEQRDRLRLEHLQTLVHSDAAVRERIETFLLARILIRFDDAQLYTKSIDEMLAALRAPLLEHRDRHYEQEAIVLADLLQGSVPSGNHVPLSDPLRIARLLILGTNALLPYSLSARQLGERAVVQERAQGLITLLLEGLPYSTKDGESKEINEWQH